MSNDQPNPPGAMVLERKPVVHHLKINRGPFTDLERGVKTGEVRYCSDRDFRVGDFVELFLMDETGNPANRSIARIITHIQRGYGLPDDLCVLSYATAEKTMPHSAGPMVTVSRKLLHHAALELERGSGPGPKNRAYDLRAALSNAEQTPAVGGEPEVVAIIESALRRSFTLGQIYWQQADSDSTCQQNKSDRTMASQTQHIVMVTDSVRKLFQAHIAKPNDWSHLKPDMDPPK